MFSFVPPLKDSGAPAAGRAAVGAATTAEAGGCAIGLGVIVLGAAGTCALLELAPCAGSALLQPTTKPKTNPIP
jgi:hypothetical protein